MGEKHDSVRSKWMVALRGTLLATVLSVTSGCVTMGGAWKAGPTEAEQAQALPTDQPTTRTVLVGGQVRFPQQLELPEDGLDLRAAIEICGGPTEVRGTTVSAGQNVGVPTTIPTTDTSASRALEAVTDRLEESHAASPPNILLTTSLETLQSMLESGVAIEPAFLRARQLLRASADGPEKTSAIVELEALADSLDGIAASSRPAPEMIMRTSTDLCAFRVVTLERATGVVPTSYFFALETALTTPLGRLPLRPGDRVFLVPMDRTPFAQPNRRDGAVSFVGMVGPRQHLASAGAAVDNALIDAFVAGTAPVSAIDVQIQRRRADGTGVDVLVVPLEKAQSTEFSRYTLHGGDQVTVAPLASLPAVQTAIVQPILADQAAAQAQQALAKLTRRQAILPTRMASENVVDRAAGQFRKLGGLGEGLRTRLRRNR